MQVEASRKALQRMVEEFNYDILGVNKGDGMRGVMRVYENEIRRPVRGAMNGRLIRAALIQVCCVLCAYVNNTVYIHIHTRDI